MYHHALYVDSGATAFTYAHAICSFLTFSSRVFETRVFMFTYSLCTLYAFAHGGMIDKKGYYFHV